MKSKIYINCDENLTKATVTEDGTLVEFFLENAKRLDRTGNIYMGVIVNVLAGMQAAFCNIGTMRNAYLSTSDLLVETSGYTAPIRTLSEGEQLLVQVTKDEVGNKGAKVTPLLSIAGRLLVMTPLMDFIGISRKIEDEKKRTKLTELIEDNRECGYGFIVRTLAENAPKKAILHEMKSLTAMYHEVLERAKTARAGELVYREHGLLERTLRDNLTEGGEVFVNEGAYKNARRYLERFLPDLLGQLRLQEGSRDLFAVHNLSTETDKLIERRCELACGGYLVFDKTEALTVIDVNSGKYVGDKTLENTVLRVNMEACGEIMRQLRLRNISGIVVVDFIDMQKEEHKEAVLGELRRLAAKDRIKTTVLGMSALGLVEITRKRARSSTTEGISSECPYCGGGKTVFSAEYLASKIRAALIDIFIKPNPRSVTIYVSDRIFNAILETRFLADKCEKDWHDKRIYLAPDYRLHISDYRIQIMPSGIVLDLPDTAKLLY